MFFIGIGNYVLEAQTLTVCDENNLQPIENVMIFGELQKNYVLTDIHGKANIENIQKTDFLIFRHPSFIMLKLSRKEALKSKTVYIAESNINISEVIISANKWAQKRSEIPSKITSITPKQIAFYNPQTTADLLATSGEVFIQKSQQGGGSPMIRGFATNRLLIAVDGVRMNTAIFRSGNLQNVISLDPFVIENTEILFGPGSVIYGSDAIGGVMSFNTLTPSFSMNDSSIVSGAANARFSSANNELTGHFDINVGWKKWSYLSSLTYTNYGDLKMGTNGPDDYLRDFYVERIDDADVVIKNTDPQIQNPTGYNQVNFMQKVRFKPHKKIEFDYGFHYSTTSNYSRYDRLIRVKNNLPKSAEWYYGPQEWLMNNLNILVSSSSKLFDEFTLRLAHQYFKESRHDRNFNAIDKSNNTEIVNAFSSNLDFHKSLTKNQQLFYGVEFVFNDVNSIGTIENITTGEISNGFARYPESNWSSYGAYLTYNFEYSKKLRLNAGARYNQFIINATFDPAYQFPFDDAYLNNGALTGSLGTVYNPFHQFWINTNISTGFRSPNIDDMGKVFDSGEGIVVIPNPSLEAEYAYNIELGITQIIADFFKYDITGYYTLLDNALVRRDFQLNGQDSILYKGEMSKVKALQNGAQTKVYGIQAGIDVKFLDGFGFDTRLNYQKGTEEMDDGATSPSRHAAPMYGVAHLTYSTQKLKLDLYSMYTAEVSNENLSAEEQDKSYLYAKDANGNPYAPSWTTLNFKAMYQFNKQLSLTAGIENITDDRYQPYSSGLTAAGRNFILAVKAKF